MPNEGNGGLFVNNTGVGYVAFDAADPNEPFGACSILMIDGIEAYSSCDETRRYSWVTGQPLQNQKLRWRLKP